MLLRFAALLVFSCIVSTVLCQPASRAERIWRRSPVAAVSDSKREAHSEVISDTLNGENDDEAVDTVNIEDNPEEDVDDANEDKRDSENNKKETRKFENSEYDDKSEAQDHNERGRSDEESKKRDNRRFIKSQYEGDSSQNVNDGEINQKLIRKIGTQRILKSPSETKNQPLPFSNAESKSKYKIDNKRLIKASIQDSGKDKSKEENTNAENSKRFLPKNLGAKSAEPVQSEVKRNVKSNKVKAKKFIKRYKFKIPGSDQNGDESNEENRMSIEYKEKNKRVPIHLYNPKPSVQNVNEDDISKETSNLDNVRFPKSKDEAESNPQDLNESENNDEMAEERNQREPVVSPKEDNVNNQVSDDNIEINQDDTDVTREKMVDNVEAVKRKTVEAVEDQKGKDLLAPLAQEEIESQNLTEDEVKNASSDLAKELIKQNNNGTPNGRAIEVSEEGGRFFSSADVIQITGKIPDDENLHNPLNPLEPLHRHVASEEKPLKVADATTGKNTIKVIKAPGVKPQYDESNIPAEIQETPERFSVTNEELQKREKKSGDYIKPDTKHEENTLESDSESEDIDQEEEKEIDKGKYKDVTNRPISGNEELTVPENSNNEELGVENELQPPQSLAHNIPATEFQGKSLDPNEAELHEKVIDVTVDNVLKSHVNPITENIPIHQDIVDDPRQNPIVDDPIINLMSSKESYGKRRGRDNNETAENEQLQRKIENVLKNLKNFTTSPSTNESVDRANMLQESLREIKAESLNSIPLPKFDGNNINIENRVVDSHTSVERDKRYYLHRPEEQNSENLNSFPNRNPLEIDNNDEKIRERDSYKSQHMHVKNYDPFQKVADPHKKYNSKKSMNKLRSNSINLIDKRDDSELKQNSKKLNSHETPYPSYDTRNGKGHHHRHLHHDHHDHHANSKVGNHLKHHIHENHQRKESSDHGHVGINVKENYGDKEPIDHGHDVEESNDHRHGDRSDENNFGGKEPSDHEHDATGGESSHRGHDARRNEETYGEEPSDRENDDRNDDENYGHEQDVKRDETYQESRGEDVGFPELDLHPYQMRVNSRNEEAHQSERDPNENYPEEDVSPHRHSEPHKHRNEEIAFHHPHHKHHSHPTETATLENSESVKIKNASKDETEKAKKGFTNSSSVQPPVNSKQLSVSIRQVSDNASEGTAKMPPNAGDSNVPQQSSNAATDIANLPSVNNPAATLDSGQQLSNTVAGAANNTGVTGIQDTKQPANVGEKQGVPVVSNVTTSLDTAQQPSNSVGQQSNNTVAIGTQGAGQQPSKTVGGAEINAGVTGIQDTEQPVNVGETQGVPVVSNDATSLDTAQQPSNTVGKQSHNTVAIGTQGAGQKPANTAGETANNAGANETQEVGLQPSNTVGQLSNNAVATGTQGVGRLVNSAGEKANNASVTGTQEAGQQPTNNVKDTGVPAMNNAATSLNTGQRPFNTVGQLLNNAVGTGTQGAGQQPFNNVGETAGVPPENNANVQQASSALPKPSSSAAETVRLNHTDKNQIVKSMAKVFKDLKKLLKQNNVSDLNKRTLLQASDFMKRNGLGDISNEVMVKGKGYGVHAAGSKNARQQFQHPLKRTASSNGQSQFQLSSRQIPRFLSRRQVSYAHSPPQGYRRRRTQYSEDEIS